MVIPGGSGLTKLRAGDSCHKVFSIAYRPVPLAGRGLWSLVEAPLSENVPLANPLPHSRLSASWAD
jgi:hypothetical protein